MSKRINTYTIKTVTGIYDIQATTIDEAVEIANHRHGGYVKALQMKTGKKIN